MRYFRMKYQALISDSKNRKRWCQGLHRSRRCQEVCLLKYSGRACSLCYSLQNQDIQRSLLVQ